MNKKYKTIFLLAAILSLVGCSTNKQQTSKLYPSSDASSIVLSNQDNTTSSTGGESQNQSSSNATSSKISSSPSSSNVSSSEYSSSQENSSSQEQSSSGQPSSISSSEAPSQSSKSSAPSSSEVPSSSQSSSSSEAPSSSQSSSSSKPASSESSSSSSEPIEIYYHITYKNYDGTILEEKDVLEGSEAIYTGETPTREDDEEYTYEFIGWDKEDDLKVVSADITATAQFKATGIWGPIIWF